MHNLDNKIVKCRNAVATDKNCNNCRNTNNKLTGEKNDSISNSEKCGVGKANGNGLHGYPLASVYAPLQDFTDIYDCEAGIARGTIFRELDLPFICGGVSRG